jgi:hypothetical protein
VNLRKGVWAPLFFCAAACLASLHLGQDNNGDLWNYHIYNTWAVLNGRWSQDLFVAGPHSFFSPFLDVPYYLVAAALFPSHGEYVVALAGLPYGALLYFTYRISGTIADALELREWDRAAFLAACVLVAGTGAATWSEIGTVFNDIPVAALVLAALYLIVAGAAHPGEEPSPRRVAVSGMLMGLAVGLKLTAAIHGPAIAVVILALAQGWRSRVRSLFIYGSCALAVFAAVYGPWAWKLHQLTGNPFFPLFNGVFESDWIAHKNFRDVRFLPRSWEQWLFYPFHWTKLQSHLVTELPFRDLRMAAAYVFVAAYVAIALAGKDLRDKLLSGRYRPVHALVLFLAFSYLVWMREFSILRYLVAAECVAGVFIVTGVMASAKKWGNRAAWLPALCVLSTAAFLIGYTVQPKWGRAPVGTDLFAVDAPVFEPGALLIFADPGMSFIAPRLAAASPGMHFMTVPRGFSSERAGADAFRHELGRRMKAKIAANAGPAYVLFRKERNPPRSDLEAFGIRLDMSGCRFVRASLGPQFLACRGTYRPPAPEETRRSPAV